MKKGSKTLHKVEYSVSVKGLPTPSGTIAFSALKKIVEALAEGSERVLRLALEGASMKKGPLPTWLSNSTDFVLTGIRKGSTTLEFSAPTLGSVAGEQIRQQDLWNIVPQPDETALSVLSRSGSDAERENLDSSLYDSGVLDTLLGFKRILDDDNVKISLTSKERKQDAFRLDKEAFVKIENLKITTPEPQSVLVTGFFNMIEHSRRRFQLTLETGTTVQGKIDEGSIAVEQMRELWGKKVTIKGILYFAASKKPRFLEAQVINPRQRGDEVVSTINLPLQTTEVDSKIRRVSDQSVVSEIWGKWPGEENIEDLLTALKEQNAKG
ncbi:MAG: hypothetical protein HY277_08520 [Ignavibacteriales bacterium]|nr:hypothetical protein [Ignavibacteriales bacterium]